MALRTVVDSDSICYACGFATQTSTYITSDGEKHSTLGNAMMWSKDNDLNPEGIKVETVAEPVAHAIKLAKNILSRVKAKTVCDTIDLYLGGEGNFRIDIATIKPYKGNRVADKPIHYQAIYDYLVTYWGATVVNGMEAEDQVSIECCKDPYNTVIAAIDKDLNNTAGRHYNWQSDKLFTITKEEAEYNFYRQVLTGDTTDNIQGCPGIGKVKAEKALHNKTTEEEMYEACLETYTQVVRNKTIKMLEECTKPLWETLTKEIAAKQLLENARLVYILREDKDERWVPPTERRECFKVLHLLS